MLDYRIDTFLAACRAMSFTGAARALNITQPAVSQHIRYLEEEYGVKLFDYRGKRLSLTAAGEALFRAATTMKRDALALKEQIGHAGGGVDEVAFGATLTVGAYVLPRPLAGYLRRHPAARVRVAVDDTQRLLALLDAGEIEFAVVEGAFSRRDYDAIRYASERFCAVCGRDYSLPEARLRIEDLLGERLLLREPGSGTRRVLELYLAEKNLSIDDFRGAVEVSDVQALLALAELNCGVTFVYEAAAAEKIRAGRLRAVDVKDFPLTHDFTFVWRKNSLFSGRCRAMYDELRRDCDA